MLFLVFFQTCAPIKESPTHKDRSGQMDVTLNVNVSMRPLENTSVQKGTPYAELIINSK